MELPEGWTEHDGGLCPVRLGSKVSVLFRDGRQETWTVSTGFGWAHLPDLMPGKDIIAFKLVKGRLRHG